MTKSPEPEDDLRILEDELAEQRRIDEDDAPSSEKVARRDDARQEASRKVGEENSNRGTRE